MSGRPGITSVIQQTERGLFFPTIRLSAEATTKRLAHIPGTTVTALIPMPGNTSRQIRSLITAGYDA